MDDYCDGHKRILKNLRMIAMMDPIKAEIDAVMEIILLMIITSLKQRV